ncbi:MAG: tannase/feruloyl esterase family alpha/beta hydrolase [Acidobacteriaceae bacterium]|nr:tannase/feruloyl esterase family alpha/beta hydrolase [Acidobacteriaceae bacterium]MBV9780249.1 tannase/feruloyl esterase family alpha/beta hydrolase [Acidobacteriaceae bacterium]
MQNRFVRSHLMRRRGASPQKFASPGSLLVLVIVLCLILPIPAAAQSTHNVPPPYDVRMCGALKQLNLKEVAGGPALITSAQVVELPADDLRRTNSYPSGFGNIADQAVSHIHQYCRVTGYVAPQNKFELKLPEPGDWNEKLFFYACGGFCGMILSEYTNLGLSRGYASATGNGGHDSARGFDGIWAANAPELQNDFGWRSNHVVTLISKAIITHYYAKPIKYSYIAGNSKGGQAVLMEAQRFPEDFDGYLPSAPVYDYTGRNTIAAAWFARAISDGHGGTVLDARAANAVHRSVLQLCSAQSGVDEGVVADPPSCKWQPEMAACRPGSNASDCLSPRQVTAVKGLMTPATNSKGDVLYAYPYIPGTETQWEGWNYFGAPGNPSVPPRLANLELTTEFEKYMVNDAIRPNVDTLKYDFDHDPSTLNRARQIYDATSFDLRALKARGGKILMWHGWADGAIVATSSIGYYQGVEKLMGGREQTEDFFRLFLIPGVHHGGGGPGFTEFDAMSALETWVEKGKAPEKLIASRLSNGRVERSRPVFSYPVLARYSGTGDPKQAQSFVPLDPSETLELW